MDRIAAFKKMEELDVDEKKRVYLLVAAMLFSDSVETRHEAEVTLVKTLEDK